MNDTILLAQYVAAFAKHDDFLTLKAHPVLQFFPEAGTETYDMELWSPQQVITAETSLSYLYDGLNLPGRGSTRLPPLYETLILSYRWSEVELGNYCLLANEPDDSPSSPFAPLVAAMQDDQALMTTLVPNGYIRFAKGPGGDYDPICFDFRHRQEDGDCRIVKLDHEAILCDWRIEEVNELATNFRSLVLNTIQGEVPS